MTLSSPVVDLTARRVLADRALAACVAAPVRFVPDALLEALQGSWGDPEQQPVGPQHLTLAR